MITSPSTSSALTRIEPRIAVCATISCPALSAKITTKNSGRLPNVDCITPVTAGPNRRPICSVANDTIHASPASASVASDEREHRGDAVRVAGDARSRGHGDRGEEHALQSGKPAQRGVPVLGVTRGAPLTRSNSPVSTSRSHPLVDLVLAGVGIEASAARARGGS